MIYRTVIMAFLPDLRELKQGFSYPEPCTDGKISQVKPLDYYVLSESAEVNTGSFFSERLYLLESKQTDLSVPLAGMRVTFDAPFRNKIY